MPTISSFCGIVIQMFWKEHPPPHFYAIGLDCPRLASSQLSDHTDRYKIKLRNAGFRLACEVGDIELLVVVIAVEKRERAVRGQTRSTIRRDGCKEKIATAR